MPTDKKKKKKKKSAKAEGKDTASSAAVPKSKIEVVSVDFERLFDTLFTYIQASPDRRRELSQRAHELHRRHGRGMYVVGAFDEDGRVRTDVRALHDALEWWNHERCVSEPLPEYLRTDPHYDPEIYRYLHGHNVDADFIVGMYWHEGGKGYCTMNTLGHYHGPGTVYMNAPSANLNPYKESEIGETITFKGEQCGAEGCDVMKAKRYVYADCEDCGATKESCSCRAKQVIDNRAGRKLQLCGKCRHIAYCSRECQVKDWPRHKATCKKMRKMREENEKDCGAEGNVSRLLQQFESNCALWDSAVKKIPPP